METQQLEITWRAHSALVKQVKFSPDGKMLVSASDDRMLLTWDPLSGREVHRLDQDLSICHVGFSPDSKQLVSSSAGSRTNLWDLASGTLAGQLAGERGGLRGPVAFSPDGATLFTVDAVYNVTMWDMAECQIKDTLSERRDSVTYLTLSPDGKTVAAGYKNRIIVWDTTSRAELMRRPVEQLNTLAFAPDGTLVASRGQGTLEFWDSRSDTLRRTVTVDSDRGAIRHLVFNREGTRAFTLNANGTIDRLAL